MDLELNKGYFNPSRKLSDMGKCALLILFLAGISVMFAINAIVGLVIWGVGFFVFIFSRETKDVVNGSDYDNSVNRYLSTTVKMQALEKLGIDEEEVKEIPPIILGGYVYPDVVKDKDGREIMKGEIREGLDGKWRSSIFKVAILFFSQNEMHCYARRFDTLNEGILEETTEVYFYQDIVSVSTLTIEDKIKVGDKEIAMKREAFKLTTKAGTSISVNLSSDASEAQQSVSAMRALLREKKQG